MWREGQCVVRGRADLVERIEEVAGSQPGGRWLLRTLYLGKRFATCVIVDDLDDAREATPADHEQAKRYADWFNDHEGKRGAPPYWAKSQALNTADTVCRIGGRTPPSKGQLHLPIPPNPPRPPEQLGFPFPAKFSPSPAGEGEPGSSGPARKARAGARAPSGGGARRSRRGGAKFKKVLMWLEAVAFGRGFR